MDFNNKNIKPKRASLVQLYQFLNFQHKIVLFVGIMMAFIAGSSKLSSNELNSYSIKDYELRRQYGVGRKKCKW